jgi:site-specific DNA-methyltransferase (adenine-specific)/modification methylase
MSNHYLIKGDALKTVPKINLIFDAVIVDPPYNTSHKNTKILKGRKALSSDLGKWDYFSDKDYLNFTDKWISLVGNKIKESGNLIIFCKLEYVSDIKRIYEKNGFKHHATIIWHKTNPSPQIRKNGFLSSCEAILWATKGFDSKKISYTFNFSKQNEMHNFIQTPICMGNERTEHKTQKPMKVLSHLIKIFTNKNDWVLDCFAGSGTTAMSAEEINVNTVNIEMDNQYFELMTNRLKKHISKSKIKVISKNNIGNLKRSR